MALEIYEQRVVGPLACNCYLLGDPATRQAIVVDPGDDAETILGLLAKHSLTLGLIVATHAHFDHVMAADALRSATGAPFYLHHDDVGLLEWIPSSLELFLGRRGGQAPEVTNQLHDGDELRVGEASLEVIHTPGHSPGSICLVSAGSADERLLLSGDTLFAGSVGRVDLPGGDGQQIVTSIRERLFPLGDLPVFPGHGAKTTMDRERVSNPFAGEGARFWG